MSGLPVFICTSAEPWAWVSVWQERITAILSACSRIFGKKSEIGIPLCPQALNGRQAGVSLPIARPPELMNFISAGIVWPAYFSSVGFGSKVSTWLGAPFMRRKITLFTGTA